MSDEVTESNTTLPESVEESSEEDKNPKNNAIIIYDRSDSDTSIDVNTDDDSVVSSECSDNNSSETVDIKPKKKPITKTKPVTTSKTQAKSKNVSKTPAKSKTTSKIPANTKATATTNKKVLTKPRATTKPTTKPKPATKPKITQAPKTDTKGNNTDSKKPVTKSTKKTKILKKK